MVKGRAARRLPEVLLALLALSLWSGAAAPAATETAAEDLQLAAVLEHPVPESLDELRIIEDRVREIADKVLPATVSVQVGTASGSGVVIHDGYVLTAGHVCGRPGREARVIFPDGKVARGVTLGVNTKIDSGLMQITEEGDWPSVEMARSHDLKVGQWCIATGHPGGFNGSRPGVVRLGRIIRADSFVIQTDCTLVGGDSGGPLFNMDGKVIGIHSRIGSPTVANFHVPVDTYEVTWERLERGDHWGTVEPGGPFLGINGEDHPRGARVTQTVEQTPAYQGGIRIGDVITHCNGKPVEGYAMLVETILMKQVGDELPLTVLRNGETHDLTITIGARPER